MALLWVLYSKTEHLPLNITWEKGKLMASSETILCCTIAMAFCVVSILWQKHVLNKNRQKDGKEAWNSHNKNGNWEVDGNSDAAVAQETKIDI
jgi:hypothetical protein